MRKGMTRGITRWEHIDLTVLTGRSRREIAQVNRHAGSRRRRRRLGRFLRGLWRASPCPAVLAMPGRWR